MIDGLRVNGELRTQTSEQIMKTSYTGLKDKYLDHFFHSPQKKKDIAKTGLLLKDGSINELEVPQIISKTPYDALKSSSENAL